MIKQTFQGLNILSVAPTEIKKVAIVQLNGLTMGQWYDKQTDKPDLMLNASLWDGDGAIGTIYQNGKIVRNEGNGFGFGINSNNAWGFGAPWDNTWVDYITGFPGLVQGGKALTHTVSTDVMNGVTKRSVIGTSANRMYMITADKMNISQLRKNLTDFGIYHAINLDGGGSSRLMVNGVAINSPTDNRKCPNAIAVWLIKEDNMTDKPIIDTPVTPPTVTGKKVFIGVGHGGKDPGAQGFIIEKDANLGMALELDIELRRHGIEVKMSRTKDEDDDLTEVIKECNAFKPDLAIDCHNNAGGGIGFEVFHTLGGGTGKTMANNVNDEVVKMGQRSRGVKTRANSSGKDYYGFIRQTACPAIIVEGVFVDNKEDAAKADTREKQAKFGVAYAKGILKTLGIPYVDKNVTPAPTPTPAPVEKTNLEKLAEAVKAKYNFDDNTMEYLLAYRFAEALLERLK